MQHDLSATRLADKGVGNVAQQLHVESTNECEEERERERRARACSVQVLLHDDDVVSPPPCNREGQKSSSFMLT
jgi:hypothetical protein